MKSKIENGVLLNFYENDLTSDGHFECLEEVTKIGGAFAYCCRLFTINLPLITDIGQAAFFGCTSLININFQPKCSIRFTPTDI